MTLNFIESIQDNISPSRCHPEARKYINNYFQLRDVLTARLLTEFDKSIFNNKLKDRVPIKWTKTFRRRAGSATQTYKKTEDGEIIRISEISLSVKVLDSAQRLRNTLIHELCHAAVWIIDKSKSGHGALWKKWTKKAQEVYPGIGEISRLHNMTIFYKYSYKCTKCNYRVNRHSNSLNTTKNKCTNCDAPYVIMKNTKNKDGVVESKLVKKRRPNPFSIYVKHNFKRLKKGRTNRQVLKQLAVEYRKIKEREK